MTVTHMVIHNLPFFNQRQIKQAGIGVARYPAIKGILFSILQ